MTSHFLLSLLAAAAQAPPPGTPGELPAPAAAQPASPPPRPDAKISAESGATQVRVPVGAPGEELLTTLAFPEEGIETAISGWPEGELTAQAKGGLLFLRLRKKSEGQLNVIGSSGTHYLLYLRGIEHPAPGAYDEYLRVPRRPAGPAALPAPALARRNARPEGAAELLLAMRLSRGSEGARILRAGRELAFQSPQLQVRLLFVYDAPFYQGLIYEVRSLSRERQVLDASCLEGRGTRLVLSALRENLLPPLGTTRLYAVAWKEPR